MSVWDKFGDLMDAADKVGEGIRKGTKAAISAVELAETASKDPLKAIGDAVNGRPHRQSAGRVPQGGDIVAVQGKGYWHYGIYENAERIYHYAGLPSAPLDICIRETDLKGFLGTERDLFVVDFTTDNERIVSNGTLPNPKIAAMAGDMTKMLAQWLEKRKKAQEKMRKMTLLSPEETVHRARNCVGTADYNLFGNNCEHFAMWCKTDVARSVQVEVLEDLLVIVTPPSPIMH